MSQPFSILTLSPIGIIVTCKNYDQNTRNCLTFQDFKIIVNLRIMLEESTISLINDAHVPVLMLAPYLCLNIIQVVTITLLPALLCTCHSHHHHVTRLISVVSTPNKKKYCKATYLFPTVYCSVGIQTRPSSDLEAATMYKLKG